MTKTETLDMLVKEGKGCLLTDDTLIIEAAMPYLPWAAAIPICGVAAFMWDGIYIGATATREMFFSLLLGTICFFVMRCALGHLLEDANDALWCSFLLFSDNKLSLKRCASQKNLQKSDFLKVLVPILVFVFVRLQRTCQSI